MTPPNLREVDCCATCFNGSNDFEEVSCYMYGYMLHYNICDDFKREE